jgi:hypothetical protein
LAATVYHLLTDDDPGDHPFQFPQLDPLPSSLSDALSRALHPEVGRRSTALEFRQALEAWLIPEDGGQPFVFGSGAVAHTTHELVSLCDQHWSEARRHLANGDFDHWFRARNRHDLVAKAKSARLEPDGDAALEVFLRRLDPRLPPPRLVVEPQSLDFGRLVRNSKGGKRGRSALRDLTVRNQGRGYAQAALAASVPWLHLEPAQVGCLSGVQVPVTIRVDAAALPLRREHQAIVTCAPSRGARIAIPVSAELGLIGEVLWRIAARLQPLLRLAGRGARRGFSIWMRTFRSLVRSRTGVWVLLGEVIVLAVVMVALWGTVWGRSPDLDGLVCAFLLGLPAALLAVFLLPALAFVCGTVAWELIRTLVGRVKWR